jgi:hypothetical protein
MDLLACALTMRTGSDHSCRDHLDADRAIRRAVVFLDSECWHIPWDQDSRFRGSLFCIASALLAWQGVFLLFLMCVCFPGSTKNKPLPFFFSLFLL